MADEKVTLEGIELGEDEEITEEFLAEFEDGREEDEKDE